MLDSEVTWNVNSHTVRYDLSGYFSGCEVCGAPVLIPNGRTWHLTIKHGDAPTLTTHRDGCARFAAQQLLRKQAMDAVVEAEAKAKKT